MQENKTNYITTCLSLPTTPLGPISLTYRRFTLSIIQRNPRVQKRKIQLTTLTYYNKILWWGKLWRDAFLKCKSVLNQTIFNLLLLTYQHSGGSLKGWLVDYNPTMVSQKYWNAYIYKVLPGPPTHPNYFWSQLVSK